MQKGPGEADAEACSHETIDLEAARYCQLINSIQQEFRNDAVATPGALFALAEQCDREGRSLEAEFIYLHFINVWEKRCRPAYPITFTGLREYAGDLLQRALKVLADEQPAIGEATPIVERPLRAAA